MWLNNAGATALGVTGAAYTNNDLDTNTNTTLFDIDSTLDQVSVQSPPNNGSLVATGKLTVAADPTVGFDNYTQLRKGVAVANNAFATLVVNGTTGFYRINLLAGTAILIDNFSATRPTTSAILSSTSRFRSNSSGTDARPGASALRADHTQAKYLSRRSTVLVPLAGAGSKGSVKSFRERRGQQIGFQS